MKELMQLMLENSRSFTKEEAKTYNKVLDSISRPTGRNIFDMLEDSNADNENLLDEGLEIKDQPKD